jgi:hypothetical protein
LGSDGPKATTSGTAVIVYEGGCHAYNGLDESFDPDGRGQAPPVWGGGEAFVLEMLSTPSGTLHLSSTV